MPRTLRFAFSPAWLALHLTSLALIVTMILLGRWQLEVSNSKHFNLQNFGYALQWWAFSTFVLVMWVRVLRDAVRPAAIGTEADADAITRPDAAAETTENPEDPAFTSPPEAYRRYVMPNSSEAARGTNDSELGAYNDYLARLAESDRVPNADDGNPR